VLQELQRLANVLVDPARAAIAAGFRQLLATRARILGDDRVKRASSYAALWTSPVQAELLATIGRLAPSLRGHVDLALLALLQEGASLRARAADGVGLVAFLKAAVEETKGDVEIVVTGHSKGGGLATTFALWLAETQGAAAAEIDRWDPDERAIVHCWSFAGPTAGNAAFATRSNGKIGDRCHRIVNDFDIVPHAWAVDAIGAIPTLYDDRVVAPIDALPFLAKAVTATTNHLGYTHVGNHLTTLPGELDPLRPIFFDQMIYQHMEAYLRQLKMPKDVTLESFFGPEADAYRPRRTTD
jgi:hypothetical protein